MTESEIRLKVLQHFKQAQAKHCLRKAVLHLGKCSRLKPVIIFSKPVPPNPSMHAHTHVYASRREGVKRPDGLQSHLLAACGTMAPLAGIPCLLLFHSPSWINSQSHV